MFGGGEDAGVGGVGGARGVGIEIQPLGMRPLCVSDTSSVLMLRAPGADLQALLSTAQLNAIHDRLASLTSTPAEEEGEAAPVVVTKAHLLEALAAT